MTKGYIVLDMPKSCRHIKGGKDGCPFGGTECRVDPLNPQDVMEHVTNGTKPEWCPIRPQPERWNRSNIMDEYDDGIVNGRNGLIDEIFGQVDDRERRQ